MVIKPTGTCFEDCTWFFVMMVTEDPKLTTDPTFKLVHGICHHRDGRPYSHAWIEHGDKAWFSGLVAGTMTLIKTSRSEFYKEFDVTDFTAYDFTQAMEASVKSDDQPPPWEEKYRRLCK